MDKRQRMMHRACQEAHAYFTRLQLERERSGQYLSEKERELTTMLSLACMLGSEMPEVSSEAYAEFEKILSK